MLSKDFALKIFEGFSIQRWSDLVRPFDIVEMDKAAEKMVTAFLIGKNEEKKGIDVDWLWMIYASLFDLLKKIALSDIKATVQKILKVHYKMEYLKLNEWVLSQYKTILDDDLFAKFTIYEGQKAGTFPIDEKSKVAKNIFFAANKFASMRELEMISFVNEKRRLEKINNDLLSDLQEFLNLEGLQLLMTKQKLFDFLMKVEQLRFQIRWNQTPRIPKTSVLGHCFFVAIITFLLCRENKNISEARLVNNFFAALFHDLPEAVTGDIISPVKHATTDFPNVVKLIEDEIVEKELVPLMDESFSDELLYWANDEFSNKIKKDGKIVLVSWDDLNEKYNDAVFSPVDGKTIRIADHLSALLEADISIKHGITSGHLTFGRDATISQYEKSDAINGIDVKKLFGQFI